MRRFPAKLWNLKSVFSYNYVLLAAEPQCNKNVILKIHVFRLSLVFRQTDELTICFYKIRRTLQPKLFPRSSEIRIFSINSPLPQQPPAERGNPLQKILIEQLLKEKKSEQKTVTRGIFRCRYRKKCFSTSELTVTLYNTYRIFYVHLPKKKVEFCSFIRVWRSILDTWIGSYKNRYIQIGRLHYYRDKLKIFQLGNGNCVKILQINQKNVHILIRP